MANPQPTDAHLRVAHSINEQLMVSHFSEQQRRILDLILRLSWGCGNKLAYIPHQKDFEIVGVREGHVRAHLDWLVEAMVIIRQNHYYQFNKDFDQWRVSRATGYTKKKLTEIVSLNLKTRTTKTMLDGGDPFPYSGHLYIAKGQNDIYKIGVSKEPESRMNSFAGLPFDVELIWDIYVKDATKIEAQIKRDYSHRHIRGEWYNFNESDISEIRILTQSVSIDDGYLRKREVQLTEKGSPTYGKGKSSTPELASPKESLKKVLKKDIYILPEWIDKELWEGFLEVRKNKKAASTDYALSLILKDLEKFKASGDDPNEILKRSIMNSWKGVFPLKGGQSGTHRRSSTELIPRTKYTNPDD